MLCGDCSKEDGLVRVGPMIVCAKCAEARIRSLEAIAVERAQGWQAARIRIAEMEDNARQRIAESGLFEAG